MCEAGKAGNPTMFGALRQSAAHAAAVFAATILAAALAATLTAALAPICCTDAVAALAGRKAGAEVGVGGPAAAATTLAAVSLAFTDDAGLAAFTGAVRIWVVACLA